jgi:GAF domain-containing protein
VPDEGAGDRADWTPTTRLAAANRMRESLKDRAGLERIAEAAAKFFADTFTADAAAITLLRGSQFRTLVTYGEPTPGQFRHTDWEPYPTSTYPQITEVLRAGRGYVSSVGNPGGIPESQQMLNRFRKGSCIGAPIVYHQEVLGEVYLSRRVGVHSFNGKDLAVALDLARQLGFRIGPAVVAQDANNPDWWPVAE